MGNVPVGSVVYFWVESPDPLNWQIATIDWSGGTPYASYLSADASQAPPASMSVSTHANTTGQSYYFIVDSNPRTYTVSVSVTYVQALGTSVQVQASFDSIKPSASLSVYDQGTVKIEPSYPPPNGGAALIQYDNWDNHGPGSTHFPANAGMRIQATTTTYEFGGSFMFLQTIQPQRSLTVNFGGGNQDYVWSDGVGGTALDSYPNTQISYITDSTSATPIAAQWDMVAWAGPKQNRMGDTPWTGHSNADAVVSMQVGIVPPGVPTNLIFETFQTYLMYRPQDGVWVALAQLDWKWSGGMIRDTNGDLISDQNNPPRGPAATLRTPPPIGPSWDGLGANYRFEPVAP
ncbi:hypothetical protein [Tautonia rosea]|uniref:hypothetical protein n=1 Tax=Tautonia rosea TaxID=2728037 RepID=UPI001475DE47|nr:hypothetical protein [Tautonia rosea]